MRDRIPNEDVIKVMRRYPSTGMATYFIRNWLADQHKGVTVTQVRRVLLSLERAGIVERMRSSLPNEIVWRITTKPYREVRS